MTNNENENGLEPDALDDPDLDSNDSFEDFEGGTGKKMLDNPMVKVGIIVAAVATIIGGIVLFGGKDASQPLSRVRAGDDVTSTPGMEEVSPQMRNALEQTNEEAALKAQRTGGSAIPVPINAPQQTLEVPDLGANGAEDPLERWRKIQEERQKREAMQQRPNLPQADPNAGVVDNLAKAMSQQMQTILDAQGVDPIKQEIVSEYDFLEKQAEAKQQKIVQQQMALAAAAGTTLDPLLLDIMQPAGTIEYAQLITEANSDAPGPVLAQVMSGPLRGARILGTFATEENYLVLTFKTIVVDGVSYSADVIALDPSSANPGLVTEKDNRYFSRVVLPAAAAFIEGLGSAIADSGSNTSISVEGDTVAQTEEPLDTRQEIFKGVEEASGKVSEIIDEEAGKIKPLIKVHAGTAVGILFLQPVTKDSSKAN